ncbi:hypothetical protein SAMN03159341_102657 [Paenibacillus sp. 1_12]|nr:hypothetical protein SAMN03159341_102657 [Paenibacillus sp. 1_12]
MSLNTRLASQSQDVNGGSTADGAGLIQWTDNGGANQKWQLFSQ